MKPLSVLLLAFASTVACASKDRPQSTSGPAGPSGPGVGGGGMGGMMSTGGSGGTGGVVTDCNNNVEDGLETDVDCGGPCAPCMTGDSCDQGPDCESLVCKGKKCADATCTDMQKNQNETDVDCGGLCQKKCATSQHCLTGDDCEDLKCDGGVCLAATCSDLLKNGEESDIDCGGICSRCPTGQACDGPTDCVSNLCTGSVCACPTGMVTIPIQGGGSYCIDKDEITYDEYDDFVSANPTNLAVPMGCEPNDPGMVGGEGYIPTTNWPPVMNPTTAANHRDKPVAYVDWCDAYAYCQWNSRRLCGRIGDTTQIPITGTDYRDEAEDQWYNACSSSGINVYPYGQIFDAAKCAINSALRNTNPNTACLGGFSGLFNMSGNVAEWELSCGDIGTGDQCRVRGGSYSSSLPSDGRCDASILAPIMQKSADVGFRCCL